jgi:hypothetical protein
MKNLWLISLVDKLQQKKYVYRIARSGFLRYGRGAISLDVKNSLHYTGTYLTKFNWQCALLDAPRRKAIIEIIDTYDPLSQAVVVAFSS